MATNGTNGLSAKYTLTPDEEREAKALLRLCNDYEHLDLKLSLDIPEVAEIQQRINAYVYYADGALVGLCTLDGVREVELCGMVHPERRRHGIGHELLAAALDECRRRGSERVLLICEDASQSGKALVASASGRRSFAELRMALDVARANLDASASVTLRKARRDDDIDALARTTASAFRDSREEVAQRITEDMADPQQVFYLGERDGQAVGSLKVYYADDKAYIYAFGVLPEDRGKGLGRAILTQTIRLLADEGQTTIALEVETENTPALTLYRSCGFQEITTYGYYELPM